MLDFLDRIPFSILVFPAVFMLLAPFYPMPHVIEKIIMLKNNGLKRPLDIFDLIFHPTPLGVLIIKRPKSHP